MARRARRAAYTSDTFSMEWKPPGSKGYALSPYNSTWHTGVLTEYPTCELEITSL